MKELRPHVGQGDNGDVWIEWTKKTKTGIRRLGLVINKENPGESSWFLVANEEGKPTAGESGQLDTFNLDELLDRLVAP